MDSNGLVNDAFWLSFAKDYVTKAISARDDAASKLETFLTAIWGVYTPLLAAGIAFDLVSDNIVNRIFMALPVFIVPFARFKCIDVQLPVSVEFFPNEVYSIEFDCYATVLTAKSRMLKWAVAGTIIAILSIAVALFIYKVSSSSDDFRIGTALNATAKDIHVNAKIDPGVACTLTVIGYAKTDAKNQNPLVKTWNNLKADTKGNVDVIEPLDAISENIKTVIEWTYKDKSKVLTSK